MSDQHPAGVPSSPTGPLQLNPQDVIAELESIPEARPYWELAQERAARKAVQAKLVEQANEVEQLRQENARLRATAEPADGSGTDPAPESGVVTREV